MSGFDVHPDEMPQFPPLDDAELEAWLTGRNGAADEIEPLALFAEDLGTAMSGAAPSPKSDLALLLAEGFSPETPDLPPARRRKMLVPEFLTGLAAKLAGMGLAAKLGLGVGVAAASVGGAGAAGVLPGPIQDVISTAVSTVTPFELPGDDTLDDTLDDLGDDGGDGADDGGDGAGDGAAPDTNPNTDFGKAVSADARGESDGVKGVDGQVISELARNKNNERANGNGGGGNGTTGADTGASGTDPEVTGLDRANQTPAAGKAPTSVPAQGGPGNSPGSNGLDKAKDTPAGDRVPASAGRP